MRGEDPQAGRYLRVPVPVMPPMPSAGEPPASSLSTVDGDIRIQPRAWLAIIRAWPLTVILAIQAALALRLTWSNTAFNDEGLYLWAGRLEWAHLLHSEPIPGFAYYFSGDPLLYPPLGAIANAIGGLVAARILSLCFMLLATCLLWATSHRLYGRLAAISAAALWAPLGPVLHVSALATFDAMSIFLMAVAAYSVVRGADAATGSGWAILAGCSMAAADLTAYSSAIFDPVVIGLAFAATASRAGSRVAWARLTELAASAIALVLLVAGNRGYLSGALVTVLNRASGTIQPGSVLRQSLIWTGVIVVLACVTAVLCAVGRARRHVPEVVVLAIAGMLVPLEQARLHTATSLDKHLALGAWFAAVAAGYGVSLVLAATRPRGVRLAVGAVAVCAAAALGVAGAVQATALYDWANVSGFVRVLRPLVYHSRGPILVENPSPARYYLGPQVPWQRWSSTFSITAPVGKHGRIVGTATNGRPEPYVSLVRHGYFSIIALDFHSGLLDDQIAATIKQSHRYRLIERVRYGRGRYVIWVAISHT